MLKRPRIRASVRRPRVGLLLVFVAALILLVMVAVSAQAEIIPFPTTTTVESAMAIKTHTNEGYESATSAPFSIPCNGCHVIHKAEYENLLMADGIQVCATCHDLGSIHTDPATQEAIAEWPTPFDCFSCHTHGTGFMPISGAVSLTVNKQAVGYEDLDQDGYFSPGDRAHYRIDYENSGPEDVTGVMLVDELDEAHVASVEAITGGGLLDLDTFDINWDIGVLAAGASGSVTYEVVLKDASAFGGSTTTTTGDEPPSTQGVTTTESLEAGESSVSSESPATDGDSDDRGSSGSNENLPGGKSPEGSQSQDVGESHVTTTAATSSLDAMIATATTEASTATTEASAATTEASTATTEASTATTEASTATTEESTAPVTTEASAPDGTATTEAVTSAAAGPNDVVNTAVLTADDVEPISSTVIVSVVVDGSEPTTSTTSSTTTSTERPTTTSTTMVIGPNEVPNTAELSAYHRQPVFSSVIISVVPGDPPSTDLPASTPDDSSAPGPASAASSDEDQEGGGGAVDGAEGHGTSPGDGERTKDSVHYHTDDGHNGSEDLELEKKVKGYDDLDNDGNLSPGDRVHYRVDYGNRGLVELTEVILADQLDKAHVASVEGIIHGGVFDEETFELRWDIGTLAAGESDFVTYDVVLKGDSAFGGNGDTEKKAAPSTLESIGDGEDILAPESPSTTGSGTTTTTTIESPQPSSNEPSTEETESTVTQPTTSAPETTEVPLAALAVLPLAGAVSGGLYVSKKARRGGAKWPRRRS